MANMQRLEDQITQIEAEIKYVREKVEKENEPALVLALRQELAALRQERSLSCSNNKIKVRIADSCRKVVLPCMAK